MLKQSTEAYKSGCFHGCVDVQHSRQVRGLVGYDAHCPTIQMGETHYDVGSEVRMYFHELFVIHHTQHYIPDVVGPIGLVGHNIGKAFVHAARVIQ